MPSRLKRYQQTGQLHYVTFTCYRRVKHLETDSARDTFAQILERVRRWYRLQIIGYVVMPEHVHMLMSEPERASLGGWHTLSDFSSPHDATGWPTLPPGLAEREKPGDRRDVFRRKYN